MGRGLKTTWSTFRRSQFGHTGLDDPSFAALMDELHNAGHEIVPHRTRPRAQTRADVIEDLPYYYEHFGTRNWITHGFGSGSAGDPMCADPKYHGWNPEWADYYIMDLLEQYGYEYVWCMWDYDRNLLNGLSHRLPEHIGDPYYLLWQNTNLALPNGTVIWQWLPWHVTPDTFRNELSPSNVDRLIRDHGFTNLHSYFAFYDRAEGNYFHEGDPWRIDDRFDAFLARCQYWQEEGSLWFPTFVEHADWLRSTYKVSLEAVSSNEYRIVNDHDATIEGMAFLIERPFEVVKLNDVTMNSKVTEKGVVVWGDLPVGESSLTFH